MADKTIPMFLLLLILFISQESVFSHCEDNNEDYKKDCSKNKKQCSIEEITAQILSTMANFANIVDTQEAINMNTDFIHLIIDTTSILLESSSYTIDKIRATLFSTIFLNQPKNPGNCLDDKIEKLNTLSRKIITDRNECVTVYHNTGLDWLLNINITLNEIKWNITNLPVTFYKCLFDSHNDFECSWQLLNTIQGWSTKLPETIATLRNNAEKMADVVTGNVTNCISMSVASYATQIINFVLEISRCIHPDENTSEESYFLNSFYPPDLTQAIFNIDNIVHELNRYASFIDDCKNQSITKGIDSITKLFGDQISVINSMKDQNILTEGLPKCITKFSETANNEMTKLFNLLRQCQTFNTQALEMFISTQIRKFMEIMDKIVDIPIQFIRCSFDMFCISEVFQQIHEVLDIANELPNLRNAVMVQILPVPQLLEECSTKITATTVQFISSEMDCWNKTTST